MPGQVRCLGCSGGSGALRVNRVIVWATLENAPCLVALRQENQVMRDATLRTSVVYTYTIQKYEQVRKTSRWSRNDSRRTSKSPQLPKVDAIRQVVSTNLTAFLLFLRPRPADVVDRGVMESK